ncbi:hypothetical protein OH76DRAFT_1413489 [Lentinus brumalis]|uniref:Uncharacterized protein n=1 Tax=Lentinus brumalis TaxID=2498619 RepID=A0A371CH17_9APHY|nr:hypothetical protein OH76DRAFT_1413489 [Polyporus brumalis]
MISAADAPSSVVCRASPFFPLCTAASMYRRRRRACTPPRGTVGTHCTQLLPSGTPDGANW